MAGSIRTTGRVRKATIEATVTRADGTVEHLGVISSYHRNPIINLLWKLRRKVYDLARYQSRPR